MNAVTFRTRVGEYRGELTKSAFADAFWLSLPVSSVINMLGCEIYFEVPAEIDAKGERTTVLNKRDIAFWPEASALCLFFGPTPLSGEDGRPISPYPVIKIGELVGEIDSLAEVGDRTKITVETAF